MAVDATQLLASQMQEREPDGGPLQTGDAAGAIGADALRAPASSQAQPQSPFGPRQGAMTASNLLARQLTRTVAPANQDAVRQAYFNPDRLDADKLVKFEEAQAQLRVGRLQAQAMGKGLLDEAEIERLSRDPDFGPWFDADYNNLTRMQADYPFLGNVKEIVYRRLALQAEGKDAEGIVDEVAAGWQAGNLQIAYADLGRKYLHALEAGAGEQELEALRSQISSLRKAQGLLDDKTMFGLFQTLGQVPRMITRDIAEMAYYAGWGAGMGGTYGSVAPGVGTVAGAVAGATAGAAAGVFSASRKMEEGAFMADLALEKDDSGKYLDLREVLPWVRGYGVMAGLVEVAGDYVTGKALDLLPVKRLLSSLGRQGAMGAVRRAAAGRSLFRPTVDLFKSLGEAGLGQAGEEGVQEFFQTVAETALKNTLGDKGSAYWRERPEVFTRENLGQIGEAAMSGLQMGFWFGILPGSVKAAARTRAAYKAREFADANKEIARELGKTDTKKSVQATRSLLQTFGMDDSVRVTVPVDAVAELDRERNLGIAKALRWGEKDVEEAAENGREVTLPLCNLHALLNEEQMTAVSEIMRQSPMAMTGQEAAVVNEYVQGDLEREVQNVKGGDEELKAVRAQVKRLTDQIRAAALDSPHLMAQFAALHPDAGAAMLVRTVLGKAIRLASNLARNSTGSLTVSQALAHLSFDNGRLTLNAAAANQTEAVREGAAETGEKAVAGGREETGEGAETGTEVPEAVKPGDSYFQTEANERPESVGGDGATLKEFEQEISGDPEKVEALKELRRLVSLEGAQAYGATAQWSSQTPFQKDISDGIQKQEAILGIKLDYQQNIDPTDPKGKRIDARKAAIVNDLLVESIIGNVWRAVEHNANAIGWYNDNIVKMFEIADEMFPELAKDQRNRFAFVYALATTSNGMAVNENLPMAVREYNYWKEHGAFEGRGAGTAAKAMAKTLEAFTGMEGMFEDVIEEIKFFMTPWTVRQMTMMGYSVTGELMDTIVRGAATMGPKIGNGFYSNLQGEYDALTMDRWFMRTFGRVTATSFTETTEGVPGYLKALRDVLKKWGKKGQAAFEGATGLRYADYDFADDRSLIRFARDASQLYGQKKATRAAQAKLLGVKAGEDTDDIRTSINNLAKNVQLEAQNRETGEIRYFTEKLAPSGGKERTYIRTFFGKALDQIQAASALEWADKHAAQARMDRAEAAIRDARKADPNADVSALEEELAAARRAYDDVKTPARADLSELTMADLQAILWYAEKILLDYIKRPVGNKGSLSYDMANAPNYANAMANVVKDWAKWQSLTQEEADEIKADADAELKKPDTDEERAQQLKKLKKRADEAAADPNKKTMEWRQALEKRVDDILSRPMAKQEKTDAKPYEVLNDKEKAQTFAHLALASVRQKLRDLFAKQQGGGKGKLGSDYAGYAYGCKRTSVPGPADGGLREAGDNSGRVGGHGGQLRVLEGEDKRPVSVIAEWKAGSKLAAILGEISALRQKSKGKTGGASAVDFVEIDPADIGSVKVFHKAAFLAWKANKHRACVTLHKTKELMKMRLFLSKDGKTGFALEGGDNIVSVFNAGAPGAAHSILECAKAAGGRRLDCFDTVLPGIYALHGFVPVAKVKFDPEYKPKKWDYELYEKYNGGKPDVVFMVLNEKAPGVRLKEAMAVAPYFDQYDDGVARQMASVPDHDADNEALEWAARGYDGEAEAQKEEKARKAAKKAGKGKTLLQAAPISPEEQARREQLDRDYFDAIESGDTEKVQRMVQEAAERAGFGDAIPEQSTSYKLRTKAAPKKTKVVYKTFYIDESVGLPTTLFVSGAEHIPQGVWLDATEPPYKFKAANGTWYVPTTKNPHRKSKSSGKTGTSVAIPSADVKRELVGRGYVGDTYRRKGKVLETKNVTAVSYRPGWHAAVLPHFPQGGIEVDKKKGINMHEYNKVVFECEINADTDYTEAARSQPKARTKSGGLYARKADFQEMVDDGFYYYATNARIDPLKNGWVISNSIKINRALTQEECDAMLKEAGEPVQAWEGGNLDLQAIGVDDAERSDAYRKTLAPITYDESGNVIPLSQRFDPDNPSVLYQTGERQSEGQSVTGGITELDDGTYAISVLKGANLSTMLHELGHFYFLMAQRLAAQGMASPQLLQDLKTLENWTAKLDDDSALREEYNLYQSSLYGGKAFEELTPQEKEEVRARGKQEMLARGFEQYLREGKAPSSELKGVFARIKEWMLKVYRSALDLHVELTDEVRDVFDRIMANDMDMDLKAEEMQIRDETDRLLDELGVEGEERLELQTQIAVAKSQAADKNRLLRDRRRRENMRRWAREAEEEARAEKIQKVREAVRKAKVDLASVKEAVGDEAAAQLTKRLPGACVNEGGVDVRVLAEENGYASVEDMVRDLTTAPSLARRIKELVRQKEADHDAETDSLDALYEQQELGEQQRRIGELLEKKIQKITGGVRYRREVQGRTVGGEDVEVPEEATAKYGGNEGLARWRIGMDQLRQKAREALDRLKLSEATNPAGFRQAAAQWMQKERQAILKKDYVRALECNYRARINIELARQAAERRDLMSKLEDATRRRLNMDKASVNGRYAIYCVAMAIKLFNPTRKMVNNARDKTMDDVNEFLDELAAAGYLSPGDIPPEAFSLVGSWRALSWNEAKTHVQALLQLLHGERELRTATTQQGREDLKTLAERIGDSIRAHKKTAKKGVFSKMAAWEKALRSIHAAHLTADTIALLLDGDVVGGPAWNALIRPINIATWNRADRLAKAKERLEELFLGTYTRKELCEMQRTKMMVDGVPDAFTKEQAICILLNWGNQSNRDRLMAGYGLNEEQVQSIIDTLDKRDVEFCQRVWDYLESFRKESFDLEESLTGVRPEAIEPMEVQTRHGTLRGGYYPAVYDPEQSSLTAPGDEPQVGKQTRPMFPVVDHGSMKQRSGKTGLGAPLRLSLRVVPEHVVQTCHMLAFRRPVAEVAKLLRRREINSAIQDTAGVEIARALDSWLKYVAGERPQGDPIFAKVAGWVRMRAAFASMALKLTTMLAQTMGILYAIPEIGLKWTLVGVADMFAGGDIEGNRVGVGPMAAYNTVCTLSAFMRHRMNALDREIFESTSDVIDLGAKNRFADPFIRMQRFIQKKGFLPMAYVQMYFSDLPTWLGAYKKRLSETNDPGEAVLYADATVTRTQGGGSEKDLAAVQRGRELGKLMTMYYTVFGALYNLSARRFSMLKRNRDMASVFRLGTLMLCAWFAEPVITGMLQGKGPDEDEPDKEDWMLWAAKEAFFNPWQMVVGVRDIANVIDSKMDGIDRQFSFGSGLSIMDSVIRALYETGQEAFGETKEGHGKKTAQDVIKAAGQVTGLIPTQAILVLQAFWDWLDGTTPEFEAWKILRRHR